MELIWGISVAVIPIVLAITLHEASHGYVAHLFGDDTAWNAGRVSANPLRHIDPFGTILLPGILLFGNFLAGVFLHSPMQTPLVFGYAKPVPINFWALRNPKRDMVWVAAAGPISNLLMATAAGLLMHLTPLLPSALARQWFADNFEVAGIVNVMLATFNMIPLPPLDGGRVAVGLLPRALAIPLARMERYGILILLGLLILVPVIGEQFGYVLNPVGYIIHGPVTAIYRLVAFATGNPQWLDD